MHALSDVDRMAINVLRLTVYFQAGCPFLSCSAIVITMATKADIAVVRDTISNHHVFNSIGRPNSPLVCSCSVKVEAEYLLGKKACASPQSPLAQRDLLLYQYPLLRYVGGPTARFQSKCVYSLMVVWTWLRSAHIHQPESRRFPAGSRSVESRWYLGNQTQQQRGP
jgi:hypothetical protein